MSKNQNRGARDFSRYDSLATEELEQLLRLDSEAPEGQELDTEAILYVMEVLEKRNQDVVRTGKTAQQAWESFVEQYLPAQEECPEHTPKAQKAGKTSPRWIRRLVAAAAVLVLLIGIPVAAGALNWQQIWDAVANWAKETFSFVADEDAQHTEPSTGDELRYTSLQQALAESGEVSDLIPNWIPAGYKLNDITVEEIPERRAYVAFYSNGEKDLIIRIQHYLSADPQIVEINEDLIEIYEVSGLEFYIFSNNKQLRTVWIKDSYECYISGELTVDEIKLMIDSIGKG